MIKKRTWVIIGIAAIIAAACVFLAFKLIQTTRESSVTKITPFTEKEEMQEKEEARVGYGWSTKDNAPEAVAEAVELMKAGLKEERPDFLIIFSTAHYDAGEILEEVKNFLPNTQIYGGTSSLATMSRDGFHLGQTGSLSIMGIASERIKFGVGGANLDDFVSPKDAGKEAVALAIKNAKKEDKLPQMILITAAPGHEEEIISGIEEVVGKDTPIMGGSSADNDLAGQWKQYANDKVYGNGISLAAIYTKDSGAEIKIGKAFETDYSRSDKKAVVTKAEGRVIYELDNQPAAEVYNKWTEGSVSEELKAGGSVFSKTAFYPLAKALKGGDGAINYLSVHTLSINLPERSLTVLTDFKEREEIVLMHGNWETLLNGAQAAPRQAMLGENISRKDIYFGIYAFSAGTMSAIPEEERNMIPLLVKGELGNSPFVGAFTFGEQGFLKGAGNRHGNLMNSVVIFAKK